MEDEVAIKFCMKHWLLLRDEIEKQGLTALVSGSGDELLERIKIKDHDPLMGACMAITTRFITDCTDAGVHCCGCPICGTIESGVDGMNWIVGAVKDQKEIISKGLQ